MGNEEKQGKLHLFGHGGWVKTYSNITSHLVRVGDLNAGHALFGGLLVQWIDEAAAIYTMGLLGTRNVVTKKISEVIYDEPTHLGDVLEIFMRIKAIGVTSITIECVVQAKKIEAHEKTRTIVNCSLVFVKLDGVGRPEAHHFRAEDLPNEQRACLDTK